MIIPHRLTKRWQCLANADNHESELLRKSASSQDRKPRIRFVGICDGTMSILARTTRALRAIAPLHTTRVVDGFTFVINGSDAAALSPAIALQLSVNTCVQIQRQCP
jgi:hypothetical protein